MALGLRLVFLMALIASCANGFFNKPLKQSILRNNKILNEKSTDKKPSILDLSLSNKLKNQIPNIRVQQTLTEAVDVIISIPLCAQNNTKITFVTIGSPGNANTWLHVVAVRNKTMHSNSSSCHTSFCKEAIMPELVVCVAVGTGTNKTKLYFSNVTDQSLLLNIETGSTISVKPITSSGAVNTATIYVKINAVSNRTCIGELKNSGYSQNMTAIDISAVTNLNCLPPSTTSSTVSSKGTSSQQTSTTMDITHPSEPGEKSAAPTKEIWSTSSSPPTKTTVNSKASTQTYDIMVPSSLIILSMYLFK
ncbi:Hypothetical predicted protein [Pelobates cultripes]|uniref:Uncharacterized protein n=1 Tax=Pelobates cultripes TaxID=61616 RepID=A0AAD1WMN4_PELCU|nr:Hypothetical predicted protein [Pelobates cultripes]